MSITYQKQLNKLIISGCGFTDIFRKVLGHVSNGTLHVHLQSKVCIEGAYQPQKGAFPSENQNDK